MNIKLISIVEKLKIHGNVNLGPIRTRGQIL